MKRKYFLLLSVLILLSSCGRTQNSADAPESGDVEAEYLNYSDFLTDITDEEKNQILEKEIKDTLIQIAGIADARVSVLRDDDCCEVNVNLIYDTEVQGEESALENWVKEYLNTVFAGEENLILNINPD